VDFLEKAVTLPAMPKLAASLPFCPRDAWWRRRIGCRGAGWRSI
jgi:hypothetical protein